MINDWPLLLGPYFDLRKNSSVEWSREGRNRKEGKLFHAPNMKVETYFPNFEYSHTHV